ncbi:unnamed protein product [Cuscuta epithymum]|nr:unnamed protein product [Cuscuta epithymum]CAH9131446.1 unnamed protein product [Cuscuta epithymum]
MTLKQITLHLITNGMSYNYTVWTHHGERMETRLRSSSANLFDNSSVDKDTNNHNDEVMDIINDLYPYATHPGCDKNGAEQSNAFHDAAAAEGQYLPNMFSEEIEKYERLLKEAQDELYPGCKEFSVLTSIVELMQLKVKNLMTNKCFDELMGILKRMLPLGNKLPTSHRHAQKVLKNIGLGYVKIHSCPYDCVLFYKENEKLDECPVCKEPRYELNSNGKKIPKKVLRYFPLKPRLQRLYMSHHTADHMTWHKDGRVEDGIMRHPADTIAWKELDKAYPDFAKEARNVRLGLASDGFNPFGDIRTPYSMWPVMVVPYNLPPWMCMKKEYTMLTLLIPGKREPGKEIDVYLRPLIDELKELWEIGLPTYDKVSNSIFNLHAAVLWTISDLPGYGNLSGWSTKGYDACPNCNDDGTSMWFGGKVCFMGHRRWLPINHVWRKNKKSFNGKLEFRAKPKKLSGEEILSQVESLEFGQIGKHPCNPDKKRKRTPEQRNWTKKSIFFELEYWSKLIIRHNLDVMHIEKNVCDIILGTILDIERKSKDTFKARKDLQALGIRESLWLQRDGDKWVKKHPFFSMKPNSKTEFLQFLKSVRYPDGYAANISKNVSLDTGKITGLKSHDNHVLLQRVLPVGIRKYLPKEVVDPIVRLSSFFQQLCSKTICTADIQKLQDEIVYILCKFEQIFPPSFFVSMIHLMVHLPEEARQGGTVTERWMYSIERMLGKYKKFVRNKARPEGSIAEAYVSQESLNFCAMYLHKVETPFNKSERNFDGGPRHEKLSVFAQPSRPIMSCSSIPFSSSDMEVAHWFILTNCDEVIPFLEEHKAIMMLRNAVNIDNIHRKLFPSWFRERVRRLGDENSPLYNEELFELARGPLRAETYQGCVVNGVKFVVAERDDKLTTQNSGVHVPGNHDTCDVGYYGKLTSVIELIYRQRYKVLVFKCHWYNTDSAKAGSIKRDYHLISVDTKTRWYDSDPFILSTMAKQVFYVNDPKAGGSWKVALKMSHRSIYDIPNVEANPETDDDSDDAYQESYSGVPDMSHDRNYESIQTTLHVDDVPPAMIDLETLSDEEGSDEDDDFTLECF